ncbi:MAG: hypothetical protein IT230_09580 [Flavobacteriales bacterium]|nr:hypothetical protein [Flavobacteriales bacterium]
MRPFASLLLLACSTTAMTQPGPFPAPRPLVLVENVALPMSMAQVEQAARQAWPWSFGQEPGAALLQATGNGRIEGTARFNYRSSSVGNRLQTLGVIRYHITIQAANGQCQLRISQFTHTGNSNVPGGPINLGTLYEGTRPDVRVAQVSRSTATRLHDDMRAQVTAHLRTVIGSFSARLRSSAQDR